MKRILIAILAGLFTFPAFAQETLRLSLNDAVEYAVDHNTNTVNSRIDIEIAKKRVWESTATGLPQVNASVSYQDMLKLPVSLIPAEFFGGEPGTFQEISFGTQHNASAEVTVSQLVFNGPYLVGLQAAQTYRLMQEQNYRSTELDVKAGVAEAYYLVLLNQNLIEVMDGSVTNMRKTYEDAIKMFEAGFIEETEADQLGIALSGLENNRRNFERQYTLAMNYLKFQLGVSAATDVTLTDSLGGITRDIDVDALLDLPFNIENNIDYKLANTGLMLSQQQWNLERSAYLPTISAFYTRQESAMRNEWNFFDSDGSWYPSSILGFSLSVPITSSGMRAAKVQQAELAYTQTQNTVEMLERSLEMEALQAKYDLRNAHENFMVQKENIRLARKILDRTLIKYKEGLASSMEVTQASDQLLQAETSYTSALVQMLNAKVRLDKIMNRI
jgi:outer membrane protein TolC